MLLPPPTATTVAMFCSRIAEAIASTVERVGLAST